MTGDGSSPHYREQCSQRFQQKKNLVAGKVHLQVTLTASLHDDRLLNGDQTVEEGKENSTFQKPKDYRIVLRKVFYVDSLYT